MSDAHQILQALVQVPFLDVAYLMNRQGNVLAYAGQSAAFSPRGDLRNAPPVAEGEPESNLYITTVAEGVFLAVLFAEGVALEDVRAVVRPWSAELALVRLG